MANSSAFISAMALAKMPSLLSSFRDMDLPHDATEALLVFSGDDAAIDRAVKLAGISRDHLMPCVDDYIRGVFLHESADPLRILGVTTKDDADRLRLHRKLLLKRLHPDQSKDTHDAELTRRVLDAWKILHAKPEQVLQKVRPRPTYRRPRLRFIRVPVERFSLLRLQSWFRNSF